MINHSDDWIFVNKPSRPPLSPQEAKYWRRTLGKLLKVGIEVELNLPDKNGSCDKQNYMCQCVATFKAKKPMPDTTMCYEQCAKWNNGECSIAKEYGCVGINCVAFKQPCSSCPKYDRGCGSCPERYDKLKDPRYVREKVEDILKPTNFVGALGENGIYKVCRDGSLHGDGGIEVATVGRRVEFNSVYDMVSKIMNVCEEKGAYVNERCSIHIHLLASYLTPGFSEDDSGSQYIKNEVTELERPMPEIILANFHQLIRRYHCALIWLSAAGKSHDNFTRWEKFRKSILPYSAVRQRMSSLVQGVGSASKSKRKYAMMNYEQMKFDEAGNVMRLHVEGRYMDGNLSPATVTAHACLLYGLMLKAIDISKFGVLQSGDKNYMELQNEIYRNLCNNDGPWDGTRYSDTGCLTPYITNLKQQSKQLIRLVKSTLTEQSPSDEILSKLAEVPLTYHLMKKMSWADIEKSLMPEEEEMGEEETSLLQLIDLGAISECANIEEWVEVAANQLSSSHRRKLGTPASKESLTEFVNKLTLQRKIHWSADVGSFVSNR
jgi:hypothetical protein